MVAARVGQPAVVGPDGVDIPVKFLSQDLRTYQTPQPHKITNATHKWAREYLGKEDEPGKPSCDAIEITHTYSAQNGGPCIPTITKVRTAGEGSMDWGWDYTVVTAVDWHAFLTNLPSAKLDWLPEGGHHVCRITFEPVIGTYDVKLRNML